MFSSTRSRHAPVSHGSVTQRTAAPRSRILTLKSWNVPPYTCAAETKLTASPGAPESASSGSTACLIAAIPDDVHRHDASPWHPYDSSSASVSSR